MSTDSPERYRPLAALPVAAAYVDADGGVRVENDWFRALRSACSAARQPGERFTLPMLFVEEDREAVCQVLRVRPGAAQRVSRALTADGSFAPVLAEFTPIRRRSGRGVVWFVALRPARPEAAPLDLSSRTVETAGIVHDLRAPVQVVLGWASVLRRRHGEPARLEHALTFIERSAELLSALLEDLLEQTRPEWSRTPARLQEVDLARLVASEVEAAAPLAEERGVAVSLAVDSSGVTVRGNALQLRRVVMNLIGNAVKFTPGRGDVACRLWRSGAWAGLEVRDTGPGIAPDLLPRIFDPFVREPGRRLRRRSGGFGLGLAVVRHLVEQHGGTVTAASPGAGGGTTFTVLLPAVPDSMAAGPAAAFRELATARRADSRGGGRPARAVDAPARRPGLRAAGTPAA